MVFNGYNDTLSWIVILKLLCSIANISFYFVKFKNIIKYIHMDVDFQALKKDTRKVEENEGEERWTINRHR